VRLGGAFVGMITFDRFETVVGRRTGMLPALKTSFPAMGEVKKEGGCAC
jgi:hypothetical protein